MFYDHYLGPLEALLFASGDPLSADKIAQILQIDLTNVADLIYKLQQDMAREQRGLAIVEVAGGYQLCTKPELLEVIEQLGGNRESRLSTAAMETLAIIAFKQPITRQEIEQIRGVKVDRVIATLLERKLIQEMGRKEALGRPILYGTTDTFLQCFGLRHLGELPDLSQFQLTEDIG